jgi:hypothetical protein
MSNWRTALDLVFGFGEGFVGEKDMAPKTVGFDVAEPILFSLLEKFGLDVLVWR